MLDAGSRGADQGGAYPQPCVLLAEARAELPDVPTTEEATGHKWHKGVWRGFAAPGVRWGDCRAVRDRDQEDLDSAEFKEFMNRRGFDMIYLDLAGSQSS